MTILDVAVVGGGPCGSFTAFNMAKRGLNVKVFEEHNEIGFPVHCSGHLSIKGLADLGLLPLPSKIVENTFSGAKFYSPKGLEFYVRFQKPVTCVVNRSLFDKYVARLAESLGVEYCLGSRVESLIFENNFVSGVNFNRTGRVEREQARIVVDAEGVRSRILRQARLATSAPQMLVKAANANVEKVKDVESDIVYVFLGNDYSPGFYAWLIPKRNGEANVGLAAKEGNPKALLQRFISKNPAASKMLRKARIVHVSFHSIPLGGFIPKAFSNGFLVVGDAASQVKPTTGGGVVLGMNCARVAAETVCEAFAAEDFSAKFLSVYQKRLRKSFGFDVKAMLVFRRMLNALSDAELELLIKTSAQIGLDREICSVEDLDFQGKALVKLLHRPKILQAVLCFFLLFFSAKL